MGILSRLFGQNSEAKGKTGNAQKDTGAGPALAAHSKDAKATGKSGQSSKAADAEPVKANGAKPAAAKAAPAKTTGTKATSAKAPPVKATSAKV